MQNKLLSIILLSYFSEDKINLVYSKIKEILKINNISFEFIIIDDGSTDDSFQMAKKLEKNYDNIKAYQLSKNYTTAYSIFAGLKVCKGSCAIAIPDDEQQPYSTIVEMYRLWEDGNKIIIPYRTSRNDSLFTKLSSKIFYSTINKLSDLKYPPGGADLFFIDREVIDIINNHIRPINTFIIPELLKLGFNPYLFPYERPKSTRNISRWSFKKRFKLASNIFFSSSSFLIKVITVLGLFFSLFSFILIVFYTYIKLFGNSQFWGFLPAGWTFLVLLISLFSGIVLLSLGIIAEYLWRIYEEVKGRPPYIIRNNKND